MKRNITIVHFLNIRTIIDTKMYSQTVNTLLFTLLFLFFSLIKNN